MGEALPVGFGKYSVIRRIATGGMAEVYLCRLKGEKGFEKYIAVKRIQPRFSSDPRFNELFIREAQTAASLIHPNLVQVFDFGKEGDSYFLAMEFIEGKNLAQVLSRARNQGLSIPLPVWGHWVGGILSGIGYLHSRGILHRDISPSNVLLSRGGLVKITDYGISLSQLDSIGTSGGLEGKCAYFSPEQARGGMANKDSDLFAAAAIAAEMFLPERLFGNGSPAETIACLKSYDGRNLEIPGLPSELIDVLRTGLSGERIARFKDAGDFLRAIRSVVPVIDGRTETLDFWLRIFPDAGGEEETRISSMVSGQAERNVVRERREEYRGGKEKWTRIGILTMIMAISAAGYGFWSGLAWKDRKMNPFPETSMTAPHREESRVKGPSPLPGDAPSETRSGEAAMSDLPEREDVAAPVSRPSSRTVILETDPPGVSVLLEDGTFLGKTPVGIDLTPWIGKKILFRRAGYEGKDVSADHLVQVRIFRVELDRQTGYIDVIQAIPWAKVYEGSKYLGDTPIHGLILPVGIHRLRFVNEPLSVEETREVSIRAGANPKMIVPLVGKR